MATSFLFLLERNDVFEKRGERGYIRGEYSEPVEVVKKQRVVDYYEEAD